MLYKSQLLHRGHIDGLDVIFPSKDPVKDIVGGDLVVFDHTTHLQLLDAESNIDLLGLVVPSETVDLESQDSLGQLVEVGHLLVVNFHLENHDGLGNRLRLFGLFYGLGSGLGGRLGSITVISEGIEFFLSFLLFFTFVSSSLGSLLLASPNLKKTLAEGANEEVPVVCVRVGSSVGKICIG
jgi:hypothetical protein